MRPQLKPFLGHKCHFSARVREFGFVRGPYRRGEPTICLCGLYLYSPGNETVHVGHAWAHVGKTIAAFNPRYGDRIEFDAWVREYRKVDAKTREEWLDYSIRRLSNLTLISPGNGRDFAYFCKKMLRLRADIFVTDNITVPGTAPIPEGRREPCIA